MASRKKVRPTPVPSGPALLRPAVGVLVLSLGGAAEVGCKIHGEPPMNPPSGPPMVEPPMDAPMPDAPMPEPMPEPMPPPVEEDSGGQEELPPMPPPPEEGAGGPPPMPNPGNRSEPTPKTDATP